MAPYNNMNVENLARVFAPTLLRSPGALSADPVKAFAEVSLQKTLLQRLIGHAVKCNAALDLSGLHLSDRMMSRMQNRSVESVESASSHDDSDAVERSSCECK
jgi:hypothetical protein